MWRDPQTAPLTSCCSFVARLRPSLLQITSLNSLRAEVEQLRVERYSQENPKHEKMLLKVEREREKLFISLHTRTHTMCSCGLYLCLILHWRIGSPSSGEILVSKVTIRPLTSEGWEGWVCTASCESSVPCVHGNQTVTTDTHTHTHPSRYFSSTHTGQARSVLTSSQHPVIGYV